MFARLDVSRGWGGRLTGFGFAHLSLLGLLGHRRAVCIARLVGCGGETRQIECDPGPSLGTFSGHDFASVGIGDGTHDGQPQSRSAGGAISGGVSAVKAVEDAFALVYGDTRPIVFDHEPNVICSLALES
jgi:hypothetical protein